MALKHQFPRCRHPNNPNPHADGKWVHFPTMRSTTTFIRMWSVIFLRPGERQRGAIQASKRDWSVERIDQFWAGLLEDTHTMAKKRYENRVRDYAAYNDEVREEIAFLAKLHFPTWKPATDGVNQGAPGSVFSEPWKVLVTR